MDGGDNTFLKAVIEAFRRRLPIWHTAAALVGFIVLLRLVPVVVWWRVAYGELRLDLWWPLVFCGICAFFYLAGQRRHRLTGEPQFLPFSARIIRIACLLLLVTMTTFTASHWNLIWSLIVMAAIAGASYELALATVAYCELWRTSCHGAVAATISRGIESGKIESTLKDDARNKLWGSPHGLRLVYGHYQDKKRVALSEAATRSIPVAQLDQAVKAGDALLYYLDVPWGTNVLNEPARRWLQLETARELLTICLTTRPEQWIPHRLRITRWMGELRKADEPYYQFLLRCFELAAQRQLDLSRVRETLIFVRGLYSQGPGDIRPPEGVEVDLRATMQHTWLALAHHGIPAQAAFDLWMDIRREAGSEPFLMPKDSESIEYDAALGAARKFLTAHYADWAESTAPGWSNGLAARRQWNARE